MVTDQTIYLPAARRWKRVRLSILRCFFLRMRLRRFFTSEPIERGTVAPKPSYNRRVREVFFCPMNYPGDNPLPLPSYAVAFWHSDGR